MSCAVELTGAFMLVEWASIHVRPGGGHIMTHSNRCSVIQLPILRTVTWAACVCAFSLVGQPAFSQEVPPVQEPNPSGEQVPEPPPPPEVDSKPEIKDKAERAPSSPDAPPPPLTFSEEETPPGPIGTPEAPLPPKANVSSEDALAPTPIPPDGASAPDSTGAKPPLKQSEVINATGAQGGVAPSVGELGEQESKVEPSAAKKNSAVPSRKFIRGNLVHVGTRELLSRFDHIGVALGPAILDSNLYLGVDPGFSWHFDSGISVAAHVPLRLLVLDGGSLGGGEIEYGGLKVRKEDWDEVSDFGKILRFLTFGRKEEPVYITVNTMRPSSIGHGMLMSRYQGNIDIDRSKTGLLADFSTKYGGFEFQVNDITLGDQLIGTLAFIKPLSFLPALSKDNLYAQTFSLGVEYAADFSAPRCVVRNQSAHEDPQGCIQGSGLSAGPDPFGGQPLERDAFARSDGDSGLFDTRNRAAQAAGLSAEVKVYKDKENTDVKVYSTWHKFINDGGGSGVSLGVLSRLNYGDTWRNAFRFRTEYRTFGDGFLPAYFDTLYEIDKYSYQRSARTAQVAPTKYQAVFGDPSNGFARPNEGQRHGFNLEASWGLFKKYRRNKQVSFGVGLQDSNGPDDTSFYAHLEFPMLGFLQLFGTVIRNNVSSLGDAINSKMFTAQNSVVLTGLRLQVLPVFFINANYSRSFQVVGSPGSEYYLGNETLVDAGGIPSSTPQTQLFDNVQTLFVTLEFGWEGDDR